MSVLKFIPSETEYTPEQLASLQKDRPKNETDKRFVLSKEEFLTNRLHALKGETGEMQDKYDEVLSVCLFGSMVKGTAHQGSDIDGYLFVDSGVIAQKEGVDESEILESKKTTDGMFLSKPLADKYISEFRNSLKEKTDLDDEGVEGIKILPMSERVIDEEIEVLLKYFRDKENYDIEYDNWLDAEPKHGSDVKELLEYQKSKPKRPEFVTGNLSHIFHLDVGGGIRKYRKFLIDKLKGLGEDGEKIWAGTIQGTEMLENNLSTDDSKRYPRTLDEAVKVYAS